MEVLIAIVIVALVAAWVSAPLRRDEAEVERRVEDSRIAELEARKQAKYREIRDTELDYRMGKLSEADYRRTDRELRGEAIELLRAIDRATGRAEGGEGSGDEGAPAPR